MQKKRQCTQFYVFFLTTIMTTIITWRSVNSKWFYICVYRVHLHFCFFPDLGTGMISIAWYVYSVSVRNNILVPPWLRFCCVLSRTGQSWCKFRMDEVTRRCDPYVHFMEDATLCAFCQMASVSPPDWPLRCLLLLLIEPAGVFEYMYHIFVLAITIIITGT